MRLHRRAFAFVMRLFVAKSNHGIDAHGAARGDVACHDGHNNQQHGDAGKGQWVMCADAKELVGHETRQSQRSEDADGDAG